MRILDARIHGLLDLAAVAAFLLGPLLFGLGGNPAAISYTLAVVHLVMTLLTRFPMGRWKRIPFVVHGIVELVVGIFLLILPSIAGYAPGSPARRFYMIMGAFILVVWALTAYGTKEREA
ncbi:MAG: hypothetical protein M3S32_01455 [Acidobacteriota bacterium]|nr:hypothetical protein [Acidobacteriota bacterium]